MEKITINLPPRIRRHLDDLDLARYQVRENGVEKASLFSKLTGTLAGELLKRIDRLQHTAVERFHDFSSSQMGTPNKKESRGWALVREYKKAGTGFDYGHDRLAADSIVKVKTMEIRPEVGEVVVAEMTYWIADQVDPATNLPFVYFYSPPTNSETKNDVNEARLVRFDRAAGPGEISAANFFRCSEPGDAGENFHRRSELEIWKQGASSMARNKVEVKKPARTFRLAPNLKPI